MSPLLHIVTCFVILGLVIFQFAPLLSRPQFPPLLPGMEVKTDGETDVKAHLVLRGKMVIQVLDYRDIEPQMSKLISTSFIICSA